MKSCASFWLLMNVIKIVELFSSGFHMISVKIAICASLTMMESSIQEANNMVWFTFPARTAESLKVHCFLDTIELQPWGQKTWFLGKKFEYFALHNYQLSHQLCSESCSCYFTFHLYTIPSESCSYTIFYLDTVPLYLGSFHTSWTIGWHLLCFDIPFFQ